MPDTLLKPYCTVAEVRSEIGNDDAALEDKIVFAVNQASRAIDRMCRRDFWFHDHSSDAFRVPPRLVVGSLLLLPFEIITLTEVREDDDEALSYADEDYDYEVGRKLVTKASDFTGGKIYVKGTFGFAIGDTATPPAELYPEVRRACVLIASAWTQEWRKEKVDFNGNRESLLDTRIPAEAGTLLRDFRLDLGTTFG